MADISVTEKQGRGLTWLWALAAIVAVAGLMLWLAAQPEPTATAADGGGAVEEGEAVELATLAADPGAYADDTLSVAGVAVSRVLGPQAVLAEGGAAAEMLVIFGPDVAIYADSTIVGQRYAGTGTVRAVTDSLVQQWVRAGMVQAGGETDAGDRDYYLHAIQLTPAEEAGATDAGATDAGATTGAAEPAEPTAADG